MMIFEIYSGRIDTLDKKEKGRNVTVYFIFTGKICFRFIYFFVCSFFLILGYSKSLDGLFTNHLILRFILFLMVGFGSISCYSIRYMVLIMNLMKSENSKKFEIYSSLVCLLSLIWLAACLFFLRLILRSSLFSCGLILIDLFMHEIPEEMRKGGFFLVWFLVMIEVVWYQMIGYLAYYGVYTRVHLEEPPLLLYYVLPDIILLIFMLITFFWAWRPKKKRTAPKPVAAGQVTDGVSVQG